MNVYFKGFTAWKVSQYGVLSDPNTGKNGPEKTPYLVTLHVVVVIKEQIEYKKIT